MYRSCMKDISHNEIAKLTFTSQLVSRNISYSVWAVIKAVTDYVSVSTALGSTIFFLPATSKTQREFCMLIVLKGITLYKNNIISD